MRLYLYFQIVLMVFVSFSFYVNVVFMSLMSVFIIAENRLDIVCVL